MFTSPSNKELIWGLLKEQTKTPLTEEWKAFFESQIKNINTNRHQYSSMVQMNKHLIAICMASLEEASEKRYSSKERFSSELKQKQHDLKRLQNGPKPSEIDFTSTNNKTFGDLNQIMDQTMLHRQKDLRSITQNYSSSDVKNWLNIDAVSNGAPKLKIHKDTTIDITPKKKVKFKLGPDIYVKLNYRENGNEKSIILKLANDFRLFTSIEDSNISPNIILNNVEVFTKT